MDCIRFEIGNRIKSIRKSKNLSQEKLAELSELNISYIGQIERGDKNPSVETVYKIAKALNIDMTVLFENLTTTENFDNQYPKSVYSLMLNLDKKTCKKIYDIVVSILNI